MAGLSLLVEDLVSIHAPARGATIRDRRIAVDDLVSIHAPARGATPVRRDHPAGQGVSIHAPARGATCSWAARRRPSTCFNPRAREGRDPVTAMPKIGEYKAFQSTRPRGARHRIRVHHAFVGLVSIHAPARGATSTDTSGRRAHGRFNPRAREGRDYS